MKIKWTMLLKPKKGYSKASLEAQASKRYKYKIRV